MSDVLHFWNKQAEQFGADSEATTPDRHYHDYEISRIMRVLREGERVVDVGCGSGYATLKYAAAFPRSKFIGIDYSVPMIEAGRAAAREAKITNVDFIHGDVLTLDDLYVAEPDTVLSTRCLINLANWDEQEHALGQMSDMMKNGRLILVENTLEGLASLNILRSAMGLHAITQRHHNHYLPGERLRDALADLFDTQAWINIGSLYYLISRVVYASLAKRDGVEPRYDHPLNEIARALATLDIDIGDYSPNYMIVCER